MNLFKLLSCTLVLATCLACSNLRCELCVSGRNGCVFALREDSLSGNCVTTIELKAIDNLKLKATSLFQCSLVGRIIQVLKKKTTPSDTAIVPLSEQNTFYSSDEKSKKVIRYDIPFSPNVQQSASFVRESSPRSIFNIPIANVSNYPVPLNIPRIQLPSIPQLPISKTTPQTRNESRVTELLLLINKTFPVDKPKLPSKLTTTTSSTTTSTTTTTMPPTTSRPMTTRRIPPITTTVKPKTTTTVLPTITTISPLTTTTVPLTITISRLATQSTTHATIVENTTKQSKHIPTPSSETGQSNNHATTRTRNNVTSSSKFMHLKNNTQILPTPNPLQMQNHTLIATTEKAEAIKNSSFTPAWQVFSTTTATKRPVFSTSNTTLVRSRVNSSTSTPYRQMPNVFRNNKCPKQRKIIYQAADWDASKQQFLHNINSSSSCQANISREVKNKERLALSYCKAATITAEHFVPIQHALDYAYMLLNPAQSYWARCYCLAYRHKNCRNNYAKQQRKIQVY
ncbi:unnamed protein product [Orchesella dallaii]|uniref:Uncharacterized protein n=1 Tax=Orchesella dallaii TaxID=48710 RepID=A0ABP1RH52_9HEXA